MSPLLSPLASVLGLTVARPLRPRHMSSVRLLALDFDGVFTDNRVFVSELGHETVACNRSDGLGLEMARDAGLELVVLSKERNPVVRVRCEKLRIPVTQQLDDKLTLLRAMAEERGLAADEVAYVGNDVNDVECLQWAGVAIVVADAHPDAVAAAGLQTRAGGGHGAVREVCDAWLASRDAASSSAQ
ncbi:MAG: hypothetical protein DWQ36_12145 [Acidobacteria bacterium]|nr:MAG: hypothetical protein DWQ30_13490 [Acidobacteriota bacterium]REK07295.1 MAG: hypothetical protein DWQ36_12145 [Acidobacteriota bacterium]